MAVSAQSRDATLTTDGVNSLTKAAPPIFPFPNHRTVHEVDRQERLTARNAELLEADECAIAYERVSRTSMRRSSDRLLAALRKAKAA